jgi:uncharacterized BrkB/YihY/UPF0761 family membrane protein
LTPKQLAKRVLKEIDHNDLLGRASELAYNFFLALFRMLLFLVALFGVFAAKRSELQSHLFYYLGQVLLPAAFQLISKHAPGDHPK